MSLEPHRCSLATDVPLQLRSVGMRSTRVEGQPYGVPARKHTLGSENTRLEAQRCQALGVAAQHGPLRWSVVAHGAVEVKLGRSGSPRAAEN